MQQDYIHKSNNMLSLCDRDIGAYYCVLDKKKICLMYYVEVTDLGWPGLYSDMSKVGNVNLYGRQIDKHDEISG